MSRVRINFHNTVNQITAAVKEASEEAMEKAMTDLVRVSSETTPFDEGDLEDSWGKEVNVSGDEIIGTVDYRVFNQGFNYAIWTHEMNYNLGEGSKNKAGGDGMSGAHYPVGNKYLTRPHEGEAPTYRKMFEKEIKNTLKNL
ncbi:HK97 gp10 family phage protein [Bacillus cereus group sp. BfR-BA-01313]|uniref:HK97 gp10 family phage protein n=1 Tax=Bacillus cereus group sp. BfR-BA-01313 TaxID=2920290 RepID=UPI001F59DE49